MNAKTLADKLGKHPNTIYKDIKEGKIKATKVGKSYEIDDRVAHSMIVNHIYKNSKDSTDLIMDTFIEELESSKIMAFMRFLDEMDCINYMCKQVTDKFEDWEWENINENKDFIEVAKTAIKIFENGDYDNFEGEIISAKMHLDEYQRIRDSIEVIKENKTHFQYAQMFKTQISKYEDVKTKLNKEEITIKDINENIEI